MWKLDGFLALVKKLADYNNGIFDGYVIAKVSWKQTGTPRSVTASVIRQKTGYAVIRVEGKNVAEETESFLQVTLWQARHNVHDRMLETVDHNDITADIQIMMTHEQIEWYLDLVQDTNPIHRGKDAIVPGLYSLYVLQNERKTHRYFEDGCVFEAAFHCPMQPGIAYPVRIFKDGLQLATADTNYITIHKRIE